MAKKAATGSASNGSAANLGFKAKLWLTADKLRNNMDAAEYKHVVLRLIFLKYISDAFEERHQKLLAEVGEGADPEDPDEYRADNVFWVPAEARWQTLQDNAKQPTIGKLIDEAMVEMLAPYKGRVYDPCCGSAGMFVHSEKFVEEHGGRIGDIAVYGQESNSTTRRLAMMNLAIRGIEGDLGPEHADTFRRDLHKDLEADYVLANPPFNDSDWHRSDEDVRRNYGLPPKVTSPGRPSGLRRRSG